MEVVIFPHFSFFEKNINLSYNKNLLYFIIMIFFFFILSFISILYSSYISISLFILTRNKFKSQPNFFFYTVKKTFSLSVSQSIFVDIFLFPFIFISCWCNLFHLLKYLKYIQIDRKIHGETSISTRLWYTLVYRSCLFI